MSRNSEKIVGDTGHVAPHVLAAIVDARILQAEECDLDELAAAERHKAGIFGGDAKLEKIELVDIFQECASGCEDFAGGVASDAEIGED